MREIVLDTETTGMEPGEGSSGSRVQHTAERYEVVAWASLDGKPTSSTLDWAVVSHQATEESVLFSMSDRAAQQALGLWREEVPL